MRHHGQVYVQGWVGWEDGDKRGVCERRSRLATASKGTSQGCSSIGQWEQVVITGKLPVTHALSLSPTQKTQPPVIMKAFVGIKKATWDGTIMQQLTPGVVIDKRRAGRSN